MRFGENKGYGIPFYLNGKIVAWVCTTLNNNYSIHYEKMHHQDFYTENRFNTLHAAKIAVMLWFGE